MCSYVAGELYSKKKKKAGQKRKSKHDMKTFDGKAMLQNALNSQGMNTRTL